jgi:hypothetical protein
MEWHRAYHRFRRGKLSGQCMFWQRAMMRAWEALDTYVCNAISLDFATVQINDIFVAR